MAALAGHKTVYGGFSNDEDWVKVVYDYAVDGGATTAGIDVLTFGDACVVTDFYAHVETAIGSAGTTTFDLGKDSSGTAGTELWSNKAYTALTLNTVHGDDTAAPIGFAAAEKISMAIESIVVSAGKINFWFKYKKR